MGPGGGPPVITSFAMAPGGPGDACRGVGVVEVGLQLLPGVRIRTNSTLDDLVEAPEDFFGNSLEPLDVQERCLRGG